MNTTLQSRCTAFAGTRRAASGDVLEVALQIKSQLDQGETEPVLIFDDATSRVVEIDFRGSADEVRERVAATLSGDGATPGAEGPSPGADSGDVRRGPGRPKLGVVSREITLLPRHWDWLNSQPGGASVALRKLVDEARKANLGRDQARQSAEAAYRFMSAMAGNLAGFEEASRALFAHDRERFDQETASWPPDIREHAKRTAAAAFDAVPVSD